MIFELNDYKTALYDLAAEQIRTCLVRVIDTILESPRRGRKKDLEIAIQAGHKKKRCESYSTLKNYTLETLWPGQLKRETNHKDTLVNFLVFLLDEYTYYINYQKPTNSDRPFIRLDPVPEIRKHEQQPGRLYDCFYWRTDQDQIGISSLLINQDWSGARMVYHYKKKSKTKSYLEGKVWQDEENLFILLEDDKVRQSPHRAGGRLLVLYASKDKDKRQIMLGCFNGVNRDSHIPVSGMVVLRLSNQSSIEESPYLENISADSNQRKIKDVPDYISFLLANRRIKVPERTIQTDAELPLFDQYERLKGFKGTYEAYFFTFHSSEHNFKSRRTIIMEDGTVHSYTRHVSKNNASANTENIDEIDVGYMRKYGDVITIQFSYNAQQDSHKYHYYLQTSDKNNLRGIFAGVADNGLITSGKIILKQLGDDEDESNEFIRLSRRELGVAIKNQLANSTFQEFFGLDGVGAYDHFTDIPLLDYIPERRREANGQSQGPSKRTNTHPKLSGVFECYCLTKDTETGLRLPDKGPILELLPLYIEGDVVKIRYYGKEVRGNLYYDGNTWFRIVFPDKLYTLTFTIPVPGSNRSDHLRHMFGVVSSVHQKYPEASAAILIKVEKPFDTLYYTQYDTLAKLMKLEVDYEGIASFLFADWNRFIRVPSTANRKLLPRYSTYRRTFWAAACYWGGKYQDLLRVDDVEENLKVKRELQRKEALKECLDNLVRSYRHAFAMPQFAKAKLDSENFPEELRQDREMLVSELGKALNFSKARAIVKSLWDIE
ncbi:hypothetical protein [Spirosoma aerophilum]